MKTAPWQAVSEALLIWTEPASVNVAAPFAGVTNLLDRAYNTSVTVNAFGRRYFEPGAGRSLYAGLELSAR